MKRLLLVAALIGPAHPAHAGELQLRAVNRVQLRDGTEIVGRVESNRLVCASHLATGKFAVRGDHCHRLNQSGPGRLEFINGDRLTGCRVSEAFTIHTQLGTYQVQPDALRLITQEFEGSRVLLPATLDLRSGGRLLLGPTPEFSDTENFAVQFEVAFESFPRRSGLFILKQNEHQYVRAHCWENGRLYFHVRDGEEASYASGEIPIEAGRGWNEVLLVYDGAAAPEQRLRVFFNRRALTLRFTGTVPTRSPKLLNADLQVPPDSMGLKGAIRNFRVFGATAFAPTEP